MGSGQVAICDCLDLILVDCIEVAGKKQLSFKGITTAEPVAVAPAEGEHDSPAAG